MRGAGAELDGRPLEARGPGYGLEVVGLEGTKPERMAPLVEGLVERAFRIRAIGSLALTLCYVGGGRLDGMISAPPVAVGRRRRRAADRPRGGRQRRLPGGGADRGAPRSRRPLRRCGRPRRGDARHAARGAPWCGGTRMSAAGSGALLDRGVAERTAAATVAGLGRLGSRSPAPDPYRGAEVRAACEEAIGVAAQLSGLGPVAGAPTAELIDRRAWASNALDSIAAAAGHLGERMPGGLGSRARSASIATLGSDRDRGRSRSRRGLRGQPGARPVRPATDRAAAPRAPSVRRRQPRCGPARAGRRSGAVPALDRDPRDHARAPARGSRMARGARPRARDRPARRGGRGTRAPQPGRPRPPAAARAGRPGPGGAARRARPTARRPRRSGRRWTACRRRWRSSRATPST